MSVPLAATRSVARRYIDLPPAVHVLCLGMFLNRAGSFVMIFLTIYVSEHLGFGISFATKCIGAFGAGSIIASLAGGQLADRFGRRCIMLVSVFGGAGMLVLLGQLTGRWSFLTAMFLFAMLSEMYRPAASAMIGDIVDPLRRPFAFGLVYISINLGFAVAPPIGGLLAGYSFQLLFCGDALTAVLFGLVLLWFIRESLTSADEPSSGSGEPATASSGFRSDRRATWNQAFAQIAGDKTFLLFCLSSLLTPIVFVQAFATLPIYLRQLGYSEAEFGLMICVNGILIVLLQLPVTHLLSGCNRIAVIISGELVLGVGFGLTALAASKAAIVSCIVVWTFGEIAQAAFKQSVVADLSPKQYRGRYMGIFGMCHAVGLTIGAPLGGEVLSRYGPQVLWPACSLVVLAAVAVYGPIYKSLSQTAVTE